MSRVFKTWEILEKAADYPYVYSALIAVAEKDDNGFYQFLVDLWNKVKTMVKDAVSGLVGGAIGAAMGSFFGPTGAVAGAIVGAILGALIGWIIELFDNPDDILGVKPITMALGWFTKSYYNWAGLTASEGWSHRLHF